MCSQDTDARVLEVRTISFDRHTIIGVPFSTVPLRRVAGTDNERGRVTLIATQTLLYYAQSRNTEGDAVIDVLSDRS
jgi:hypothetical protein